MTEEQPRAHKLNHKEETESTVGMAQSPFPVTRFFFFSARPHPLILWKQFHHLGTNIHTCNPMGATLIQPTTFHSLDPIDS